MKKLKQLKKVPEWFRLDKYQGAEALDAAGWLDQLRFRRQVLSGNPFFPDKSPNAGTDQTMRKWRTTASPMAEQLRNSPLVRGGENEPGQAFIVHGSNMRPMTRYGGLSTSDCGPGPIAAVSIIELFSQANSDQARRDSCPLKAERWDVFATDRSQSFSISSEIAGSLVELGQNRRPIISIDLLSSDTDIKKAFSNWLNNERARRGKRPVRLKTPDHRPWADYRLLPYLDLTIWGLENGAKITDETIARSLWPQGSRGVDDMRKTTVKHAKEQMRSLASLEAAVRKQM